MKLSTPVSGGRLTDAFGPRGIVAGLGDLGTHTGRDISAPSGTPIYAVAAGTITRIWFDRFPNGAGAGGHMIEIDHGSGVRSRYAHMESASHRSVGDRVTTQSVIGHVGSTGAATGPHLHLEILINGVYVDPDKYLEDEVTPEDIKAIANAVLDTPINQQGSKKGGRTTLRQQIAWMDHQWASTKRPLEWITRWGDKIRHKLGVK